MRRLIGRLDDGEFDYEMDNGARVAVTISIDKAARSATFDFTGTSAQLADNFNAPYSIVRAASLYVVRTLIDDAIPMNDGCLRPITLVVPEGSMLNPRYPGRGRRRQCRDQPGRHRRPVRRHRAARAEPGDDEQFHLRQRRATNIMRRSPAARAPGPTMTAPSAVQTHMTNSRLTDPEILETRLPVRLERIRDPPRLGRRGRASGRRRRRSARSPSSSRCAPTSSPTAARVRAARARRRRRCAARPQLGRARRRHGRGC